jgi:hypothetical protein
MRCADAIRELATLRGEAIPGALAEHLASCPRCAASAEPRARLDRLWQSTRPEEPSPAVWEAVWARVSEAADASAPPARPWRLSSPALRWHRAAIAGMVIAQAAAILVGAVLLFRQNGAQVPIAKPVPQGIPSAPGAAVAQLAIPTIKVDVDYNQTVCIQSNRRGIKVVRVESEENSNSVDSNFVMLGILEAMAE